MLINIRLNHDPYCINLDNLGSRAVWNFTLRDSASDFINVTVWGAVDYVNNLFTTFTIGCVGKLHSHFLLNSERMMGGFVKKSISFRGKVPRSRLTLRIFSEFSSKFTSLGAFASSFLQEIKFHQNPTS